MFLIRQLILILFSFDLFITEQVEANSSYHSDKFVKNNPSIYLSDEIWEEVQDYLMQDDHPIKQNLDEIFSTSRATLDQESMVKAGFDYAKLQRCSRIIVTKHPKLSGYLVKAYLDTIEVPSGRSEHYPLTKRIIGAGLIRKSIQTHHYEHLLKVPKKWLYLLPDFPSPPRGCSRKMFILVEEDMNIFQERANKKMWKSKRVTKELLDAFYVVTTELSLSDSTSPKNAPFCKDGKVAFVDTQRFHTGFMKYNKLTPYLSASMKEYWLQLTNKGNVSANIFDEN